MSLMPSIKKSKPINTTPTTMPPFRNKIAAAPHAGKLIATTIGNITNIKPISNSSHLFIFSSLLNLAKRNLNSFLLPKKGKSEEKSIFELRQPDFPQGKSIDFPCPEKPVILTSVSLACFSQKEKV